MREHAKPRRSAISAVARDTSPSSLVPELANGGGAPVSDPSAALGTGLGHDFTNIPVHPPAVPAAQRVGRGGPVPGNIAARSANGTGLADSLKARIEHLSGVSMDDVTVHYNSPRPAQLHALAYTQGTQIHVGAGQERHLAHEAWHVVQQKQGRVAPKLRFQGQGVNDDASLEREADVMGERVLRSPPERIAEGHATVPLVPQVHGSAVGVAPIQAKWILRSGERVWVPDDYALQDGERLAPQEPARYGIWSNPEFQARRGRMREALGVPEPEREQEKIGFPFGFFDHAYKSDNPAPVSLTLRGGVKHEGHVDMPSPHTPLERILPMLPTPMTKGSDLPRLLGAPDLSQTGTSVPRGHVSLDRVREALTGLQFARNTGLDSVHQPSAEVDFQGTERATGRTVLFDPFMSPQPEKLTILNRFALQLEKAGVAGARQATQYPKGTNPKAQARTDRGWAKEAYTAHTNDSKGKQGNVVGLWDQTADTSERLNALQGALDNSKVAPGRVAPVDLRLDEEFVLEDHHARIQLEHAKRSREEQQEAKREKEQQKRSKRSRGGADSPSGTEALPWGGPGPGAVSPYGWGQNHPLYMRFHRDDGAY
ncbi:eCIS core domain-containing protein [Corallococcus aberystwythensis]|uniref:DUF4157 domain-containing protein n=1 Tax=Corallococcus aberystwythensis TaxID=2316722 RepID=A0A3A8QEK3_9BACT|nr:DUF4157 domain-containing protein [Corallococcus aberystwythensis]RKH61644.1 DUF4157 domain-containing protein [Corallococcus aberystwythensis]